MSADLHGAAYVPTIYLRPAELAAVKELPDSAKDVLRPIFCLKPWRTSTLLEAAIDQISNSFGERDSFLDTDPFVKIDDPKRQAQKEYLELISPENGYSNWISFFENHPTFYPVVIANDDDFASVQKQIASFSELGRTFLVRLKYWTNINYSQIVDEVCKLEHANFGFVLDTGWGVDILSKESWVDGYIKQIVTNRGGDIPIILSGSSFPNSFDGLTVGAAMQIRERMLFDNLRAKNNAAQLIYGDWASSRAPNEQKGGTIIPPRIDLSLGRSWHIFRISETLGGFQEAAKLARKAKTYPAAINIWATYKLEATENGSGDRIASRESAAAVRINLHLYQQLYFSVGELPPSTDEEYKE